MKRFYLFSLLTALILTALCRPANAQLTSSSIRGLVKDGKGKPVPGASVVAVHQPTGARYGSAANTDGYFLLANVNTGGPYSLEITGVGFETYRETGLTLALGQTYNLRVFLAETAQQLNEVAVQGQRNKLTDANRTGATQNISRDELERLPTVSRALSDFLRTVPQSSGISFLGRNNRFNNIQVDGSQNNDIMGYGVGGGTVTGAPGGQAGTQPISLDAIQEVQVVLSPYDVKQGNFSGAGINAITRSGTNQFSGSAYIFGRNESLVGRSPDARRTRFNNFSDSQVGFRFGGPIIKNKLFFFVNGELTRRSEPTLFTANRGTGASGESSVPATVAEEFRTLLRTRYNYEAGAYDNIVRRADSDKLFARLDWQVSDKHRITLRHNYVRAVRDDITNGVNALRFENNKYIQSNSTNISVAELRSQFGPRIANNLILGYSRVRDNRDIPGAPFPQVVIELGAAGTITAGTEGFSPSARIGQDLFQFTNNLSILAGRHDITIGTQNEFFRFDNLFIQNIWGTYNYTGLAAFTGNTAPRQYQLTYSNDAANPVPTSTFRAFQLGFYVQDAFSVTDKLKITAGIRADLPVFPDKPLSNSGVAARFAAEGLRTEQAPGGRVLLSPRVGFNYDVAGDAKTIIRGGTGIFTGRLPFVWLGNAYNNTGADLSRINAVGAGATTIRFSPDVNQQPRLPTLTQSEINLTDPDFKMPQVWRSSLAVDQQLPFGFVGTLEGIYSKELNAPYIQDINLGPALGKLTGDGRDRFPTRNVNGLPERRRFPEYTNVFYLTNTKRGYQYNLTAQLERKIGADWFASLAYTYGQSKDISSMNATISSTNYRNNATFNNPNLPPLTYSDWNLDHRIVGTASYRIKYLKSLATTVSLFYNGQSGLPYTYRYNVDVNGDGNPINDLMYVPRDQNDIVLLPTNAADTRTPAQIYTALNAFIEQDPYLSTRRGQVAERNAARTPWSHVVDLRLLQDIGLTIGGRVHTLQLSLDMLNFTNFLSQNWGLVRLPSVTTATLPATLSGSILAYRGLQTPASATSNGDGRPTYSFTPIAAGSFVNDPLQSRWRAQVGARYSF